MAPGTGIFAETVVRYPPGGRLQIPVRARHGASAAIATTMSCKRAPVALHHAAALYAWLFGARALPGSRSTADVSLDHAAEVFDACRAAVGGFDAVAVISRRQQQRRALLALLLRDDEAVAFVKAAPQGSAHGLDVERACLAGLSADADAPVAVPEPIDGGVTASGVAWTAMRPLPPRPHRPAWRAPVETIVAWLQERLGGALERDGAPAEWRPMHGDFAPWNLRRVFRGPLVLFDLEDAAYAPRDADRTYWRVTSAVLRGHSPGVLDAESAAYWRTVVEDRLAAAIDPALDERLLVALTSGSEVAEETDERMR